MTNVDLNHSIKRKLKNNSSTGFQLFTKLSKLFSKYTSIHGSYEVPLSLRLLALVSFFIVSLPLLPLM
jgi:hypothetical protein